MKLFVDSSVIIYGLEIWNSNSARILDLILEGELEAVISEKVMEEVRNYFRRRKGSEYAFLVTMLLLRNFSIVYRHDIKDEIGKWKEKINRKDLEHIATVKMLKLEYLIAYDRDFEGFKEYLTPKKFLKKIGIKTKSTEY